MRFRRITESDVMDAIFGPDFEEQAERGKTNSWKRVEQGFLKVTWIRQDDSIIIITVMVKRLPPEGMR